MKEAFKTRRPIEERGASPDSFTGRRTGDESAVARLRDWLSTPRGTLAAYAVALCIVALGYSIYTDQTWEDCLITLRHSENLLKGNGLTYNPPELVHGFTSPVNVLLLAVCHFVTGQKSYILTCWLYRFFTIAAFAGSGVLLLKAFLAMMPRWMPAVWFVAIAYLFDGKSVAFSTNGMETGFMLAAVAWAIYLMTRTEKDQWLMRGLCWAALMWSRPDGCVYIAALGLAEILFGENPRRETLISLAKSAGVCTLAYGPWIAWAWGYYGSPIPHTVIAKGNIDDGAFTQMLQTLDNFLPKIFLETANVFRPIYYGELAGWLPQAALARMVNGITKVAAIFCLIYWMFPAADRWGRIASFCFFFLGLYFSYMQMVFPWYFPPVTMFGLVALARGVTQLAGAARDRISTSARAGYDRRKVLAMTVIVAFLAMQIMTFGLMTWKEAIQQEEIEMGNRREIGLWLKDHGRPYETVYLEPLGYIGYFSGMRMVDHPGLVSPEVVRIRKQKKVDRLTIIPELKPDWVVLRFAEYQYLAQTPAAEKFRQEYSLVHTRDVNNKITDHGFLPGEGSLRYDAAFAIFHRNTPAAGPPALPPSKGNTGFVPPVGPPAR